MQRLEQELQTDICIKSAYKIYDIEVKQDRIVFQSGDEIISNSLVNHLINSEKCAIIAITLGIIVDKKIRKLQNISMADALIYDRLASDAVEQECNELQKTIELEAQKSGHYLTSRFSAGFGDFSLDYQPLILKLVGGKTGITTNENNILLPQKSITAVIGLSKNEQKQFDKCHNCKSRFKYIRNFLCQVKI